MPILSFLVGTTKFHKYAGALSICSVFGFTSSKDWSLTYRWEQEAKDEFRRFQHLGGLRGGSLRVSLTAGYEPGRRTTPQKLSHTTKSSWKKAHVEKFNRAEIYVGANFYLFRL